MSVKAKHMPYLISGIMALLFLLSVAAFLLSKAGEIRDSMVQEIEAQYQTLAAEFASEVEAIADDSISDTTKEARLQSIMADYTDSTSLSYPIRCYSRISSQDGAAYCYSRNAIILSHLADGVEESIPVYFLEDDTADIPQILTYPYSPDQSPVVLKYSPYEAPDSKLKLTISDIYGEETYYIISIMDSSAGLSSTALYELTETTDFSGALNSYIAAPNWTGELSEDWSFTTCIKSFGGDKFFTSNYTKGWWRTENFATTLIAELLPERDALVTDPGLFSTRVSGVKTILDKADLMKDSTYISYSYAAEFSPITVALGLIFKSGVVFWLALIFLITAIVLVTLYSTTRQQELSSLKDEIARQEQALSYARDAEASRREMTSAIAHELKTPLAVLSSYAEAASDMIDPEKQKYYLDVILHESRKMDQMVLELLDLSRLEAGKYRLRRENFDLRELAEEIITPLQPEIGQKELKLVWQVTNPTVNADRYRMGQIVENFMTNAIRHTPAGGRIVIRIGTSSETFSVENQGSSIPRENLKKVWETFWQGDASRNSRGSGLGLSICRSIIALHGGSCKAENTALGVKFSVNLSRGTEPYLSGIVHHEEVIALKYQIAQDYTTAENVMTRLGLIKKPDLRGEIAAGNLKLGSETITSPRQKLYPGYTLLWQEFRITIVLKDDDKRQAMVMEYLKGERGLASPYRNLGGACGGK